MKIEFDDKSFVEIKMSDIPGKILIMIQAKDYSNPLKKITNAVDLSMDEFKKLIGDIK